MVFLAPLLIGTTQRVGLSEFPGKDDWLWMECHKTRQFTDLWTGAYTTLHGPDFELCFLDEEALLVNNHADEVIEIGHLPGMGFVVNPQGECVLCSVQPGGVVTQTASRHQMETQFEPGMAHINVSRCRAEVKCGVSIFKAQRPGRMRAFWNCVDV